VLSLGKNTHGHPAPGAVGRLKASGASIWCTQANGTVTARISAKGKLSWSAGGQVKKPWWQASTMRHHGRCDGR
jgi:beta-lactamase superfamily II metal-dependent hydrolase